MEPGAPAERFGGVGRRPLPELNSKFVVLGAFPLAAADSKDAVLLVTLEPGQYSAQITGVDGAVGEALVEIYLLP